MTALGVPAGARGGAPGAADYWVESAAGGAPVVLAVDPGGTTGWCVLQVHPASLADGRYSILGNIQHLGSGEVTGSEASQVYQLLEMAREWPTAAVVVEDFVLREFQQSRDLLAPVRITAAFKWALWCGITTGDKSPNKVDSFPSRPIRPVFTQSPEQAKTTCSDERLRSWHLHAASSPHARDGIRHALLFMRRAKEKHNLRTLAWPDIYPQVKTLPGGGLRSAVARNGHGPGTD
jgi:hypothetical protein